MTMHSTGFGSRIRFDEFGCWFIEKSKETQLNTRQVIGRRREVTSQQERGVRRRKRLVDAARHFLQERDPQQISFKEIAKKAEVPEGSAYHFFANKYDVFSALAIELGERFSEAVMEPLDDSETSTWQDFISAIIDRSAQIYRQDPIARKVLLSSTMPHEVKNADHESALTYVDTMQSKLNELYEMPIVDRLPQRLLYALTLVDALFELDYNANGNLSEEVSEEAKLAMISYLSNFIPPDLRSRM